jgi:arylsulfatase
MSSEPSSRSNSRAIIPAFLAVLALLVAFIAGLVQTNERIMSGAATELSDSLDDIIRAQGPYDDLVSFMVDAHAAQSDAQKQLARLDRIARDAGAQLGVWRTRRCTGGAAESARRSIIRELHNVRALTAISRECTLFKAFRSIQGHNNPCFSYAGSQAVKEIEQGRRDLQKLIASPEQFATPLAPTPEQAYAGAAQRPNVVVVLIDTLRSDRAFNPELMPFLNQLALNGAGFTNARSQASITHQSVASLFTGLFPLTHGLVSDEAHWLNELSLVEEFHRAGYQTAAFSANDLIAPETGFGFGFDVFSSRYWASAQVLNESVFSWVETAPARGRNFFLYIHTVDPHSHYAAPDKLEQVLSDPDPNWNLTVLPNLWRRLYIDNGKPIPEEIRSKTLQKLIRNYEDEVRYADRQLEALITYLRARGLMHNTVLVVVADHGEAFLEHGDVEHTRSVYDEMIRVPIVFSGPMFHEKESVADVHTAVDLIDVLPTLLDAAHLPIPSRVQGRSLLRHQDSSLNMSMTSMGFLVPTLSDKQTMIAGYKGPVKTIYFQTLNEFQSFDPARDKFEASPLARNTNQIKSREQEIVAAAKSMADQYTSAKRQAAWIRERGKLGKSAYSANELRKTQDQNKNEMHRRLKDLGYLE